ncbi:MAG TPA: hypothetical protein VJL29_00640 [Thermoguttaceae bacterium]|nr:hypothetical protein [Thermoguttaceae bacterium]
MFLTQESQDAQEYLIERGMIDAKQLEPQRAESVPIAVQARAAGLCIRAGVRVRNSGLAAAGQQHRDTSLGDFVAKCASADHQATVGEECDVIRAALSGTSLVESLTSVAEATLLDAADTFEDSTAGWCLENTARNFRPVERWRADMAGEFVMLPRGGTADHSDVAANVARYRGVDRYAKQLVVGEEDLLGDRLELILSAVRWIVRGALRLRPRLVCSLLLSNPTLADGNALFDFSSHGNDFSGAGSALGVPGLTQAMTALAKQCGTDSQGKAFPLDLHGAYIVVPESLRLTGLSLVESLGGVASGLTVRSDSRLDLGVTNPISGETHEGSATRWYLAAPASSASGIEVVYLNNRRQPTLRKSALTDGQWGFCWSFKHDVGAGVLDYRGLVRNAGV